MLTDERINVLAKNLINFSCELKKGENILIEATGVDYQLVNALVKQARLAEAYPFVEIYDIKYKDKFFWIWIRNLRKECAISLATEWIKCRRISE